MPISRRRERKMAKRAGVAINNRKHATCYNSVTRKGKTQYENRREADNFVAWAKREWKEILESYLCPYCDKYHVGHRFNRGVKNRQYTNV